MDLLPIGSDELCYIQTKKVNIMIKGRGTHPKFERASYDAPEAVMKVFCRDTFALTLQDSSGALFPIEGDNSGIYKTKPLFYEQQNYEIVIEAGAEEDEVTFWHDNINIRKKVTRASRKHNILSGVINFGNEIGFSDFVIQINGTEYLRLVVEVYPSKISYKEDYQAIVADVTAEVYNVIFDFLKTTYLGYRQGNSVSSSPVEFFAVIRKIFGDFLKAVDMILACPHHLLETRREVLPEHKVKRMDASGCRWLEKHPDHVTKSGSRIMVDRVLGVRKQVTYDTKENRMSKFILRTTIKKLEDFKRNYLKLQRAKDPAVVEEIDGMICACRRRMHTAFFMSIEEKEADAGMSLVFSMASGYRDLYKYYLMLLRGLSATGDVFHISVKDLAVLYEYWCFIKLNSMMKDRYKMISQDIIKIQGNGLFVSLVKGQGSEVKYENTENGDIITLSYNPKTAGSPTVAQRPDNVLSLRKRSGFKQNRQYEYVFDAKYRMNPALPGTDYYTAISQSPGPEVDDINTMHRYRDAIVYQNGASPYERTMFGAYVLFPYSDLEWYKTHRFYKSIEEVNIGGLPFLPSSTELVAQMLEELIADSPDSAFERATLPRGIEEKLMKVDWENRDVLVGSLRSKAQLDVALRHNFYHIPASQLPESAFPIHYVAIYQSKNFFGPEAGIRYYGVVTKCIPVKRNQIRELPKNSSEEYYLLEVKEWKRLERVVAPKEFGQVRCLTNLFLLEHSAEYPELLLRSEEEYRLYTELKRAVKNPEIDDESNDLGFKFNKATVLFEKDEIHVYQDHKLVERYTVAEFTRSPNAVFQKIKKHLEVAQ